MQNIILFDSDARNHLLPLTATRPMGEFRLGILKLREKWERHFNASISYITQEYLQEKYPIRIEEDNLIINAGLLPDPHVLEYIRGLAPNAALIKNGELLAARLSAPQFESLIADEEVHSLQGQELEADFQVRMINRLWDFNDYNAGQITADFALLTAGRKSQPLSASNQILGSASQIFLEEGALVEGCSLNTTHGPIYIGKNAEVMEGCMLRGPISLGEDAIVKMGAKLYGPVTIGPDCRAGGEITRSIMFGNSNKAHDGYLGDAVIGSWCNIGADSNNSNLKNNYAEVKLWDYATGKFEPTGKQFCGLFMGDHAKCAINTSFNTGTVVGAFANVFGAGFPRNFIPDFSWGGPDSPYRTYKFDDACETAKTVMARRNLAFDDMEKVILYHIYDQTAKYRSWEKS